MSNPVSTRAFDPRRENVHPMFDPSKFAPGIDYYGAIYDSAVLATRLMNTPQALQHDYCFFYGKNLPANAPVDYDYRKFNDRPAQYACDKAIGELDKTDLRYVQQQRIRLSERVAFQVTDLGAYTAGVCYPCRPEEGIRQSPEDTMRFKFLQACTLLHELAHAAHHHLFGGGVFESFRENSIVSEAGFEYESRIFGQLPQYYPNASNPNKRLCWGIWQSRGGLPDSYNVDKIARDAWKMPENPQLWSNGLEFVSKLFDDDFWEGDASEYAIFGAFALIPDKIAFSCLSRKNKNTKKSIPLSIKDLFREDGPSYAKKKFARFANPERELRTPVEYDNCNQPIL